MPHDNFNSLVLRPDDNLLVDLGKGIWLMDSHRWALKVWEQEGNGKAFDLIHADQHWDAGYDFINNPSAEKRLISGSAKDVEKIIKQGDLIRYDSFIVPAVKRGIVKSIHFFCTQDIEFLNQDSILNGNGISFHVHESLNSLLSTSFEGPTIFDICLDLFNRSSMWDVGDLWLEAEITDFINSTRRLLIDAHLITISLSFGDSGSQTDTEYLAKIVVPKIIDFRS